MSDSSEELIDSGALPVIRSYHPKALSKFAFSRFIERFSFYSVSGLLVYYFMDRFGANESAEGYTLYTTLFWVLAFAEIIGGLAVDILKKPRQAIIYGGMLIATGYFILAFGNRFTEIIAFSLVLVGLSIYGPSHFIELKRFYQGRSEYLSAGLTYYLASIEIGALLAGILGGMAMMNLGWRQGFMLSGILMIAGHIYFVLVSKPYAERLLPAREKKKPKNLRKLHLCLVIACLSIVLFLLRNQMIIFLHWIATTLPDFGSASAANFIASALTILFLLLGGAFYIKFKGAELRNLGKGIIVFIIVFVGIVGVLNTLSPSGRAIPMVGSIVISLGYAISFFLVVPSAYAFILKNTSKYGAFAIGLANALSYAAFNLPDLIRNSDVNSAAGNFGLILGTAVLSLCAIYFLRKNLINPLPD